MESSLQIQVDINTQIPILAVPKDYSFTNKQKDTILAMPLIVRNTSEYFFEIALDNFLHICIIEAKDANNEWQTIMPFKMLFCGTGLYQHPLFPDEVVISAIPLFQGNFLTVGRVSISGNYSNEFNIAIDPSVFDINLK